MTTAVPYGDTWTEYPTGRTAPAIRVDLAWLDKLDKQAKRPPPKRKRARLLWPKVNRRRIE